MLRFSVALLTRPVRRLFRVTRPVRNRPGRLGVESLEDRLVPDGAPPFDYRVTNAALGSVVRITSSHGSAEASADHLDPSGSDAIAHFSSPPLPDNGVAGQGYWTAQVTLPNGWIPYKIWSPVLNANGIVYDAETFTTVVRPDVLEPACPVCPPVTPAATPRRADGDANGQPPSQTVSAAGVRLADGAVDYTEADLASDGFAVPWGQARSWASGPGYDYGQHNGSNWVNTTLPALRSVGDIDYVTGTGTEATAFRKVKYTEDTWAPTLSAQHTLSRTAPGEYTLTDEAGNRFVYHDTSNLQELTWWASTADVRGLQKPVPTDRAASFWYGTSPFTFDVNLTDAAAHKVSLYLLDWDQQGRAERVEVLDAATQAVLDTRDVSGLTAGQYLSWNLTGHMQIRVTGTAGPNAVASGLFFDPASGPAGFAGTDAATQGTWRGAYGTDGYSLPSWTRASRPTPSSGCRGRAPTPGPKPPTTSGRSSGRYPATGRPRAGSRWADSPPTLTCPTGPPTRSACTSSTWTGPARPSRSTSWTRPPARSSTREPSRPSAAASTCPGTCPATSASGSRRRRVSTRS
jgi:hypothetical protein